MNEESNNKFDKIKRHLKENRKAYLAAGGGAVVGGFGVFFATGGQIMIVDGVKFIHIQYKSPNINIVLERRACPMPIPVRDKLTGESYPSLRRAVEVTGETLSSISKDAQGVQKRFEQLPDSVFA